MKISIQDPPRAFSVKGAGLEDTLYDCARITLDSNEQVTFTAGDTAEYDVARKSWGFYATPSINGRLKNHGFRSALVRNSQGKVFVMLVEDGKLEEFLQYVAADHQQLICWVSDETQLAHLMHAFKEEQFEQGNVERALNARRCPMCEGDALRPHFVYDHQPSGEFKFEVLEGAKYHRELHRCEQCGHLLEQIDVDLGNLYLGDYVSKVWGDRQNIQRTFDRINALPPEKSDNVGRVAYIRAFLAKEWAGERVNASPQLLDVGTGLGVFPFRMKQAGWECVGVDMDQTLVDHVRAAVGIHVELADVRTAELGKFDLVTFNKVLEHVAEPVELLSSVARFLKPGGIVYVELPDGEAAEAEGKEREEFLLGHIHVFSAASYAHLIARAGFELISFERVREPSTKFTLRGFARPK